MWPRTALLTLLGLCVLVALLLALFWVLTKQTDGSIVSGGERRSYLLHVPAGYDPATPVPLVISIHGFAEWPAHQMQVSRWNNLADQFALITRLDPRLRFSRNYATGIRPYADYCKEQIELLV